MHDDILGFTLYIQIPQQCQCKETFSQQAAITLSLVSWTVREFEFKFDSMVMMSSSFFAISFLFNGLLRTCKITNSLNQSLQLQEKILIWVNKQGQHTTTLIFATLLLLFNLSFSKDILLVRLLFSPRLAAAAWLSGFSSGNKSVSKEWRSNRPGLNWSSPIFLRLDDLDLCPKSCNFQTPPTSFS